MMIPDNMWYGCVERVYASCLDIQGGCRAWAALYHTDFNAIGVFETLAKYKCVILICLDFI